MRRVSGTTRQAAARSSSRHRTLVAMFYRMRKRLLSNSRFFAWQSKVSGGILIPLGLRLAIQER